MTRSTWTHWRERYGSRRTSTMRSHGVQEWFAGAVHQGHDTGVQRLGQVKPIVADLKVLIVVAQVSALAATIKPRRPRLAWTRSLVLQPSKKVAAVGREHRGSVGGGILHLFRPAERGGRRRVLQEFLEFDLRWKFRPLVVGRAQRDVGVACGLARPLSRASRIAAEARRRPRCVCGGSSPAAISALNFGFGVTNVFKRTLLQAFQPASTFRTGPHIITRSATAVASRFISVTILKANRASRLPAANADDRSCIQRRSLRSGLVFQQVYRLALRGALGLLRSVLDLAGLTTLPVPDPSPRSAAGGAKAPLPAWPKSGGGLVVDSTGLQIRGPGTWLTTVHRLQRRTYRKNLSRG